MHVVKEKNLHDCLIKICHVVFYKTPTGDKLTIMITEAKVDLWKIFSTFRSGGETWSVVNPQNFTKFNYCYFVGTSLMQWDLFVFLFVEIREAQTIIIFYFFCREAPTRKISNG